MGSILSGRRDGKPLVEDCLSLDLAWLMRLGPITAGGAGNGEVIWSVDGERVASVKFRLDLRTIEAACLILDYRLHLSGEMPRDIFQEIALTSTAQNFGGRRWWLRCPVTGERVRKLFLPPDGDRFASRKAWGLGYRVERLSHFDRPFEKLFRLQRKLDGAQGLVAELKRPKGMWRRTYDRYLTRLAAADEACAQEICGLIGKGEARQA